MLIMHIIWAYNYAYVAVEVVCVLSERAVVAYYFIKQHDLDTDGLNFATYLEISIAGTGILHECVLVVSSVKFHSSLTML